MPVPVQMNNWFYLVSGVGIEDVDSGVPPNVLTVTGPAPNGGTAVSVVPFNDSPAAPPRKHLPSG